MAGTDEVSKAVARARLAQREWVAMSFDARRDSLLRLSDLAQSVEDEFVALSIRDKGVPRFISSIHPPQLVRWLRYYAGWVDKQTGSVTPVSESTDLNLIERVPYGVVAVIIPWNGPLFGIAMAVVPALAAGNAVVLKPPELAPLTALRFGRLCLEAGLPPGLVNVLPGGPSGGEALVRHPGIDKIHFTGSGATARQIQIAAANNLTPVATELGGKAAHIVFDDADLDAAVGLAAFTGPLAQSGQSCACGSRILVQAAVYDEFVERLAAIVAAVPIGDPELPETIVGPVISEAAVSRILGVIDAAEREGTGRLVAGGRRLGGALASGYFIEPTVFADVDNQSPLARIETFGPVVSVMRFSSEDEAVALANDTEFGLVDYVQTTNLRRAHAVARRLMAGSVYVNTYSDLVPTAPYGGMKQSGVGRLGGIEGLDEFSQVKNTRIALAVSAF
jgi:aldehyde dehydrogenase (NAD+)